MTITPIKVPNPAVLFWLPKSFLTLAELHDGGDALQL